MDIHNIRLRALEGQLGDVLYQFTKIQFSHLPAGEGWRPMINAYRCRNSFEICVDLAGVPKEQIDLQVEPRRLTLRGRRQPPEPVDCGAQAVQILSMEIDHGVFGRDLEFSVDVDPSLVTAEQRNGLLWIHLPFRAQA
jgi:HSP20 family molecular chaperone IbpA